MSDLDLAQAKDTNTRQTFGQFQVGQYMFGIPADVLVEVLPITDIDPFPSSQPDILGSILARNTVTPLLDVLRLCALPEEPLAPTAAVVLRKEEQTLALGIDRVAGLRRIHTADIQDLTDAGAQDLVHSFFVEDAQSLVLLNVDALFGRSDLPKARLTGRMNRMRDQSQRKALPHLTFISGGISYAIAVSCLFNTVPSRPLDDTSVANGLFLGMLNYLGRSIPVVDTNTVLSMKTQPSNDAREIVVVHVGEAHLMGLAVDQILYINYFHPETVREIPEHLRAATPLIKATQTDRKTKTQTLILDVDAIQDLPKLQDVAMMSGRDPAAEEAEGGTGQDVIKERERNLIFFAGRQFAAPIVDVVQVLHPPDNIIPWDVPLPGLQGLFLHEQMMTPLLDLADFIGADHKCDNAEQRVLICGEKDARTGFLVDRVVAMSLSDWRTSPKVRIPGQYDMVHMMRRPNEGLLPRLELSHLAERAKDCLRSFADKG